jgi:hypothetical protein
MPGVPNLSGTPNSGELNPITPATPPSTGSGTASTASTLTRQNLPLKDWQAALGSYVALLWLAEVPTLAPFAVAIAWGTAIVYVLATNVPKQLADAVQRQQGPTGPPVQGTTVPGQPQTYNPNAGLGEITGNAGLAQGIGR